MVKYILLAIIASMTISDVFAIEYQELDENKDGYISNDEAQNMPELAGQWIVSDTNEDGRLDKSEFALFEISIKKEFTDKELQ